MAHGTTLKCFPVFFFASLLLFHCGSLSDSFPFLFVFSHIFGLLVHVSLSSSRLSLSSLFVVHTHGAADSFCIACFAWRSCFCITVITSFFYSPVWLPRHFGFCTAFLLVSRLFVSSLTLFPRFLYIVLAFLSLPVVLRYVVISIVPFCLSALSSFSVCAFTYDQLLQLSRVDDSRHQHHCSPHYTINRMLLFLRLEYIPMGRGSHNCN